MLPRLLRASIAPKYLGMTRNTFNQLVRTNVIEIPIGKTGKAFDRLDLDQWVEHTKQATRGHPNRGKILWEKSVYQDSINEADFGTLTNPFSEKEFAKLVAQARSTKRRSI